MDKLYLFNFAPRERVRVFVYWPDAENTRQMNFVAWRAFQTDERGELIISSTWSTNMLRPGAAYVAIGDITGEVNVHGEDDWFGGQSILRSNP